MLVVARRWLENISDEEMAGILFGSCLGFVFISLVALLLGVFKFEPPFLDWARDFFEWVDSFAQNAGTEMFGAFLTFIFLEVVRGSRERKAQEDADDRRTKETQELVRNILRAQDITRLRAAKTLDEQQSILDGLQANDMLQGANLSGVDIRETDLEGANLREANLRGTYLQGVNLRGVNLAEADLFGADLQDSDMFDTSLTEAHLSLVNLRGVRNLTFRQLQEAAGLGGATLPDGTKLPVDTWRETFETWCETAEWYRIPVSPAKYIKAVVEEDTDHDNDDD